MTNKLYVGGLSYTTTEQGLEALFQQAGSVQSTAIIKDRDTGQSKGFGFVEMSSDSEAATAISKFNGFNLDGRTIKVNEAQDKKPRQNTNSRW